MAKQFIDKTKNDNLRNGVMFYACGLIISDERIDGKSAFSGKDFVVEYIDPWGNHNREWRSADAVEVTDLDEYHAGLLRAALQVAETRTD